MLTYNNNLQLATHNAINKCSGLVSAHSLLKTTILNPNKNLRAVQKKMTEIDMLINEVHETWQEMKNEINRQIDQDKTIEVNNAN